MQCACAMLLSSVAYPVPSYFSIFRKSLWNINCVLIFCTSFIWNIFNSKNNSAMCYLKCTYVSLWNTRHYSQIWNWIFWTDFRKILKYCILWQPVHWDPSCLVRTTGQTEWQDKAGSRFSQFCEGTWEWRRREPRVEWASDRTMPRRVAS
jgi:hypothetical protein